MIPSRLVVSSSSSISSISSCSSCSSSGGVGVGGRRTRDSKADGGAAGENWGTSFRGVSQLVLVHNVLTHLTLSSMVAVLLCAGCRRLTLRHVTLAAASAARRRRRTHCRGRTQMGLWTWARYSWSVASGSGHRKRDEASPARGAALEAEADASVPLAGAHQGPVLKGAEGRRWVQWRRWVQVARSTVLCTRPGWRRRRVRDSSACGVTGAGG